MLFSHLFWLGHNFFIQWITLHFQEFQSAAIGKKIKIKIELKHKIQKISVTSEA